jgi:O-antigen/teichoic acid export membrane protein
VPTQRPESIRQSAIFAGAVQLAGTAFTAVLTLYLVRALGNADYGRFALALAVGAIVVLPSDFGVSSSTARYIAQSFGDLRRITEVVSVAIKLKAIVSSAVGTAIFLAAPLIARLYGESNLTTPVRVVAVAVTAQGLFGLASAVFTAHRQMRTVLAVVTFESASETIASIALVAGGAGVVGATVGRAAGYVLGAAAGLVILGRRYGGLRAILAMRFDKTLALSISRYAGAVAAVDVIWAILSQIDVLMMGIILTPVAVAAFQAPSKLLSLATYPGLALANALSPRLAGDSSSARTVDVVALTARRLLIVQAFGAAFVFGYADLFVRFALGHRYVSGSAESVLRGLAPFVILSGLAPLLSTAVDYVGGARRRIPIAAVTLAVNVGLNLLLLSRVGPVGAAVAVDVAYAIFVTAHAVVARQLFGLDTKAVGRTLLVAVVAAGSMIGIIELIRAAALGPGMTVAAGVLGSVAFIAVVAAAGDRALFIGSTPREP